jgi:hypothetical protein
MNRALYSLAASLLLACLASPSGAQDLPYTEGPVMSVSYIRIKPGMFDKYMQYLDTDYKQLMDAQKKEGVILDYAVYTSPSRDEKDWDMVLTTTYKNMGALDNLRERAEPLTLKTLKRTREQSTEAAIDREAMRELVGSRLLRKLELK